MPIHISFDVVDEDIPVLVGLDVSDGNFLMADSIPDHLWHSFVI